MVCCEARDAAQSLRALMNLLTDCDAYHTLLAQEDALVRAGMTDEAVRTRQVWTRLLALLEQMHEIAGGARIPGSTVTAWIEAGLMDEGISIPAALRGLRHGRRNRQSDCL